LSAVARMLRQEFDRAVAELGITRSQWTMIVVVARRPGATQREIAEVLDVSEASAGRLIDRLCADGLLERHEHPVDRRARAVSVTDKAKPLLDKLSDLGRSNEQRVFRDFSEAELDSLSDLLDKLYRTLSRN
jgi:MarR family transcriptional regulator, transcriptional regulator for hemolysin